VAVKRRYVMPAPKELSKLSTMRRGLLATIFICNLPLHYSNYAPHSPVVEASHGAFDANEGKQCYQFVAVDHNSQVMPEPDSFAVSCSAQTFSIVRART
jgi:hypothetical protein